MTKPKFPYPEQIGLPAFPDKVSPPLGIGRPKGLRNRSTILMKEAIEAVYRDLQEQSGSENGHFLAWAKDNPGPFYKLCLRLLPLQVDGRSGGPRIGTVVFVRAGQADPADG